MSVNGIRYLNRIILLTCTLIIAFLALSIMSINPSVVRSEELFPNSTYAYKVDLGVEGLTVKHVLMLNETSVLVVGSLGGADVVTVLDVRNPYEKPTLLQIYPLVGSVTSFSTDGFPVSRIALGTDKGEVTLFKVEGGRIIKLLHAILGADFYVRKLYVLKAPTSYKLAVLVSEGGEVSGVCASCYVYVFDESEKGVFRMGPKVGNATIKYERIYPQDIIPLTVFNTTNYYYDATKLGVVWIQFEDFIKLYLNITYRFNATLIRPASNALVEVLAYNKTSGLTYRYGFNANKEGSLEIPIPKGFYANITLWDVNGKAYVFTFDPKKALIIEDASYMSIFLPQPPITLDARRLYKIPEFLMANVEILDVSNAPSRYLGGRFTNFKINTTYSGISFVKGFQDQFSTLVFYNTEDGYLTIYRIDKDFKRVTVIKDYVGLNTACLNAITYVDGRILTVTLKDGRIKSYELSPDAKRYSLIYTYVTGSEIRRLTVIPSVEGYAYVISTSSGLQYIKTSPYLIPVFRNESALFLTYDGYVDGDLLSNLKSGVIFGNGLIVLRNLDVLAPLGKPFTLKEVLAPKVVLKVNMPGNESVTNATVVFKYPGGFYERRPGSDGIVTFENIIPGVTYEVFLKHVKPYINPINLSFTVREFRDVVLTVNMTYKMFKLKLNVNDGLGGDLIAPYKVVVDGKTLIASSRERSVNLNILYGTHTVRVEPAQGFENVYEPFETTIYLDRDMEVDVGLNRLTYVLEVRVEDSISKKLIAPLIVDVNGVKQIVDSNINRVYYILPYGNYTVYVEPSPESEGIYLPTNTSVVLKSSTTAFVRVSRVTYYVDIVVKDATINRLMGEFEVYVNESKVAVGVKDKVSIPLYYGLYSIQVRPSSDYTKIYEASSITRVKVDKNLTLEFPLKRKFYTLRIKVQEGEMPIRNAEVTFYSVELDTLITKLLTDENGVVETSLFYGPFKIEVTYAGYYPDSRVINLVDRVDEVIYLTPQPITLLFRYLPIVAVIIIAAVAVIGSLKLRAIIARRLTKEETLF